jgi:NAD(P)-dependent dehydrogenase (short-subunit alcohol dehydrogenase family)
VSDPNGVIITGGTGALGRALVTLLLERGARVAVPWRGAEGWRSLQEAVGADAPLHGFQGDLADPREARTFVEKAVSALETLDGLALIAGGWAGGTRFEMAADDEWGRMVQGNLNTVAHVVRAALPHLLQGGGSVVTVGAQAAQTGGAEMAAYAVAKSGVHALTRVLALENRDRGVRFNCVLPGTIDTPSNRQSMPDADTSDWTPPGAIARVMAFLLSTESAPISGALVPVNGPV